MAARSERNTKTSDKREGWLVGPYEWCDAAGCASLTNYVACWITFRMLAVAEGHVQAPFANRALAMDWLAAQLPGRDTGSRSATPSARIGQAAGRLSSRHA